MQLPASVVAFQVRDSIVAATSRGAGTDAASAATVSQLGAILKELDDLGSPEAIAAHLEPWRVDVIPGDSRGNALARYLQWKLSVPEGVSIDHQYAQIKGWPAVPLPPQVASFQLQDARRAPSETTTSIPISHRQAGSVGNQEDPPNPVGAAAPRGFNSNRMALGLFLAAIGLIALLSPFITLGGTTTAATVSVYAANGMCSSGIGQFAQGVDAQLTQQCGLITLGFLGSWVTILIGAGLLLIGLFFG